MNLQISGHHVEITESLRSYVLQKMERIKRHFEHVIDAHVVLDVQKFRHKAEITLNIPGQSLHAEAEASDMYASIDKMVDRLDRQISKQSGKMHDHHAKEGHAVKAGEGFE